MSRAVRTCVYVGSTVKKLGQCLKLNCIFAPCTAVETPSLLISKTHGSLRAISESRYSHSPASAYRMGQCKPYHVMTQERLQAFTSPTTRTRRLSDPSHLSPPTRRPVSPSSQPAQYIRRTSFNAMDTQGNMNTGVTDPTNTTSVKYDNV